jgi:hypothetical protein
MSFTVGQKARHDHRQSLWIIAGGALLWCYRCGAWRVNKAGRMRWHTPTGPRGKNPAMDGYR